MLKRTSIWLDEQSMKRLERIAKNMGGLKVSQVVRIAIQEYINRAEAHKVRKERKPHD